MDAEVYTHKSGLKFAFLVHEEVSSEPLLTCLNYVNGVHKHFVKGTNHVHNNTLYVVINVAGHPASWFDNIQEFEKYVKRKIAPLLFLRSRNRTQYIRDMQVKGYYATKDGEKHPLYLQDAHKTRRESFSGMHIAKEWIKVEEKEPHRVKLTFRDFVTYWPVASSEPHLENHDTFFEVPSTTSTAISTVSSTPSAAAPVITSPTLNDTAVPALLSNSSSTQSAIPATASTSTTGSQSILGTSTTNAATSHVFVNDTAAADTSADAGAGVGIEAPEETANREQLDKEMMIRRLQEENSRYDLACEIVLCSIFYRQFSTFNFNSYY